MSPGVYRALRIRILRSIAATSLLAAALPVACSTGGAGSTSPETPPTCSGGRAAERTCFEPNGILWKGSNYGGPATRDAGPPPPRDNNGCMTMEEVMDGCCNAAQSGPTFEDGKCCYSFCGGGCCGRPLRASNDEPRVAHLVTSADWLPAQIGTDLSVEAADLRALLHADYLADAVMEHASIASFAAFVMELMAVGAPAALVQDACIAIADETRHAQLTFGLARRFASLPSGPSAVPLEGVALKTDLKDIARAAARDGCVGETIASLVAAAQAAQAEDPDIRATLLAIANDEARHAELAWRFVAWAVAVGGEDVRQAVAPVLAIVPATSERVEPSAEAVGAWHAFGRITAGERMEITFNAMREVIAPAALRVVGDHASSSPKPPKSPAKLPPKSLSATAGP